MKRGFHWLAQLPDGLFAILYADPVLKNVHRQVVTFETEREARAHAKKNSFELLSAANLQPSNPHPRTNIEAGLTAGMLRRKVLLDTVMELLPKLFKDHPDGIAINDLVKRLDIDYEDARHVLIALAKQGHGKWMRDQGQATLRKLLVPKDAEVPDDDGLSFNQRAVLEVLTKRADAQGLAQLRLLELSQEAGVQRSSVTFILHELCRKNKIEIADMALSASGRGGLATTVRVLSKTTRKRPMVFYQKSERSP